MSYNQSFLETPGFKERRRDERGERERGENEKVVTIVLWKGTDVSTMRMGESATETYVAIVLSPRKRLPRPRYFQISIAGIPVTEGDNNAVNCSSHNSLFC